MPLNVSWMDDAQSIICCESAGRWTWDEYHVALEEIRSMMSSVNHRVDVITVTGPGAVMPKGSPMPHFQRAAKIMPDNLGLNIIVVRNVMLRKMAQIMGNMPGMPMKNIRIDISVEDALELIAADRQQVELV